MIDDVETRIRERAFGIWEREGCPGNRADAHWFIAAREVLADKPSQAAAATKPVRRSALPGGTAKAAAPKRAAAKAKAAL